MGLIEVVKLSGHPQFFGFLTGAGAPNPHVVQGSTNHTVGLDTTFGCRWLLAVFSLAHICSLSGSFMALTVWKNTVIPSFLQKSISYFYFSDVPLCLDAFLAGVLCRSCCVLLRVCLPEAHSVHLSLLGDYFDYLVKVLVDFFTE